MIYLGKTLKSVDTNAISGWKFGFLNTGIVTPAEESSGISDCPEFIKCYQMFMVKNLNGALSVCAAGALL